MIPTTRIMIQELIQTIRTSIQIIIQVKIRIIQGIILNPIQTTLNMIQIKPIKTLIVLLLRDVMDKIKMEIYSNGPVACGIHVTDKFEKYSGGIFSEKTFFPLMPNHILALVGFGEDADSGERFWIGRNSWGT